MPVSRTYVLLEGFIDCLILNFVYYMVFFSYSIGLESNPVKDPTPSSEGTPVNGGAPTHSAKKFHGYGTACFGTSFYLCLLYVSIRKIIGSSKEA